MARNTSALKITKPAHKRFSYERRSRQNTRGAAIMFRAFNDKPEFVEDADGHMIRQWKKHELRTYTTGDIQIALRGANALDEEDMLEHIPPSAIKYCVTKGWLFRDGPFYRVTRKAAAALALPHSVGGRKIHFYDSGLA